MISGFDTADVLGDGVADAAAAWVFLRRFAAGWAAPLANGDGFCEVELVAAEHSLGLRLPDALRAAYRLLGRRLDLTCNQDVLLAPERCRWDEAGEVLVFRVENQGCARWGVRRADLDFDDPPVVFEAGCGWLPFLERTSLACVEMVLSETLLGGGQLVNACELSAELLAMVTSSYQRLRFPDYPVWASPSPSLVHWYAAPGKLLRVDGNAPGAWLFVRGQTAEDVNAICSVIPGDWTQFQGTEDD